MPTITDRPAVDQMREKLARIGRLLFDRQLTDAAGGNLTARVGDLVCMSPSFRGSQRKCKLTAEDVLVLYDYATERPRVIPDELVARLEAYEGRRLRG